MRQFFTLRFWLTLAALGALTLGAVAVARRQRPDPPAAASGEQVNPRRVDLLTWAYAVMPGEGFALVDGRTTADMAVVIDGTRTMYIAAGTEGEIDCPGYTVPGRCTIAANLLGDAVLWFSIISGPPAATITLPAVREVHDDGWVLLANGWEVQRADRIDRLCDDDTASLADFIRTFGDSSTSTFNVEAQRVVRVTCPKVTATTTTVAESTISVGPTLAPDATADPAVDDEAG